MKNNKDFFYLQYNKINWSQQEKTKINFNINTHIINNVFLTHKSKNISIFDIGFGVGFFIKMVTKALINKFENIAIEGCEPEETNYNHFIDSDFSLLKVNTYKSGFIELKIDKTFDYITAIYVFTHFLSSDIEDVAKKVHRMLNHGGVFILVLANEEYIKEKLHNQKDLFIESGYIHWNRKKYKEFLHYTDIPEIGKVIDYNREESFYIDIFTANGFNLEKKEVLNDNGFQCSIFLFCKS